MIKKIENLIAYSYYSLFFLVPLVMHPKTSELFEFNKMITVYFFTILIVFLWVIRMALTEKIIFKKTRLDIFLIIFFLSQLTSTLFSVDIRTSLFGYYSRFHGGLLSTVSYILLYWAYVSNMDPEKTKKTIYYTFTSAGIVSIWAIFEHFGKSFSCLIFPGFGQFDVSCWIQDVAARVFATFGQPNWLAAWIVAIIPLTWAFSLEPKTEKQESGTKKYAPWLYIILSAIFFLTLLYTKSRSGLLAFAVISAVFWSATFILHYSKKITFKELSKKFIILNSLFLILVLVVGTPFTAKLILINPQGARQEEALQGPALEVGGTESGQIRRIVWEGALDLWKNHSLIGTGVETFAFTYYKYRPVEHNLVSEWNFLYNKAHNEYLNFAATTGTIGLIAYLLVIGSSIYQILNVKAQMSNIRTATKNLKPDTKRFLDISYGFEFSVLSYALLAGYVSILVTNFFGFSVVAVALLFFLFPALAVSLTNETTKDGEQREKIGKLTNTQVSVIAIAILLFLFTLNSLRKYWYADYLYTKGKSENDSGLFAYSRNTLLKAIEYSPNESVFWDELADTTSSLAIFYAEKGETETAEKIAQNAVIESDKAISLSPRSVILKKTRVRMLANLSLADASYMQIAKETLLEAKLLAPTDAHISYNLAITYFRTGDEEAFLDTLKETIEMKPNYKDARYALAQHYIHANEIQKAKDELEYILKNIDIDPQVEKELAELENNQ